MVGSEDEGDIRVVGKELADGIVQYGHVVLGLGVVGGKGVHRVVGCGDVDNIEILFGHQVVGGLHNPTVDLQGVDGGWGPDSGYNLFQRLF